MDEFEVDLTSGLLSVAQARRQIALKHMITAARLIGDDPVIGLKVAVGVASTQKWFSLPEVIAILEELSGKPAARWVS